MRRPIAATIALLGFVALCGWSNATLQTSKVPCSASDRVGGDTRLRIIIRYLQHTLGGGKPWARLYYRAPECLQRNYGLVQFPEIALTPPSKGATGTMAIRRLFNKAKGVTVRAGLATMPRIVVGIVPNAILRTGIGTITLTPDEQFNPSLAISAILNTRRLRDAARAYGYRFSPMLFDYLLIPPTKGLAHLPRSISNMTLDQSLDLVAETFKGIVIYGMSSLPREISIDFASSTDQTSNR